MQPDTIIPNPANPQAYNRYTYVLNSPINLNDPTGHAYCDLIDNTNREDCEGGLDNSQSSSVIWGCDLDCQFEEFDEPDRVEADEMISIGAPLPGMYDSISPAEYQLLLRQNKLGPYTYKPALDAQLAYRMFLIQQKAFSVTSTLFAGTSQLNSPADAFRHAYWNALLTGEFGPEFASAFTTAHETGYTDRADANEMSFMDLNNNQAGIDIAVANPTASDQQVQEAILAALGAGELIVWDGSNLYYSDECPAC